MGDPPQRVILFVFAGRRQNLELQLPLIRAILKAHPNTHYDVWNLARDHGDARYLQTITGPRITVYNQFRDQSPGYDHVYRHYTHERYRDAIFVKLDDDIVFIQTRRFGAFINAVMTNPGAVISANIINNGACTPLLGDLYKRFERLAIPLLDVHTSAPFAALAHNWFFEHYPELMGQPVELVPSSEWLSINLIGYDWAMGRRIAAGLGTAVGTRAQPCLVAGRPLTWLGDEGMANTLPRIIMTGFVAGHLTFGPQRLIDAVLGPWRRYYAQIGQHYLDGGDDEDLPAFERDVGGELAARWGPDNWRSRAWIAENDPRVGRFTP